MTRKLNPAIEVAFTRAHSRESPAARTGRESRTAAARDLTMDLHRRARLVLADASVDVMASKGIRNMASPRARRVTIAFAPTTADYPKDGLAIRRGGHSPP
ncbi:hypothetical protein GCM10009677_00220 [Sphaerisporangium rubeum]